MLLHQGIQRPFQVLLRFGDAVRLEKGGILIRDCSNYPGLADGYYRAAVRTHEENQILTEAVSQILQWF